MPRGGPLKMSWARIALDTSARASSSSTIAPRRRRAEPAPLLADGDAEQLGLASALAHEPAGTLSVSSPVAGERRELALGDIAGELAQRRLVLGLGERITADGPGHGAVSPS